MTNLKYVKYRKVPALSVILGKQLFEADCLETVGFFVIKQRGFRRVKRRYQHPSKEGRAKGTS